MAQNIKLSLVDGVIKIESAGVTNYFVVKSLVELLNTFYGTQLPTEGLTENDIARLSDLIHYAGSTINDSFYQGRVSEPTSKDWDEFWQEGSKISFAQWLKIRRKELGLTQKDAAYIIGISQVYYVKLETGERKYPSMNVVALVEDSPFGNIPPHVVIYKTL